MTSIDGPLPESKHLRQDINIPEEATIDVPDTSSAISNASSLNAGQHAAGVSPVDQYRQSGGGQGAGDADEEES